MKNFFKWLFLTTATLCLFVAAFVYHLEYKVSLPNDELGVDHFTVSIPGIKLGEALGPDIKKQLKQIVSSNITNCREITNSIPYNRSTKWFELKPSRTIKGSENLTLGVNPDNIAVAVCIKGQVTKDTNISAMKKYLTRYARTTEIDTPSGRMFKTPDSKIYQRNYSTLFVYLDSIHKELVSEVDSERKAFEVQQGFLLHNDDGSYILMYRDNMHFPSWTESDRDERSAHNYDLLDQFELKFGNRLKNDKIANSKLAMKLYHFLMYTL